MDSDLPYDDEFFPSHAAELEDTASRRPSENEFKVSNNDASTYGDENANAKTQSSLKSPVEARWDRLKRFYNDDYKNLFLETFDNYSEDMTDYRPSQYGAVIWSPEEKLKFFSALKRYGKGQVQRIATQIGTKSEIEVRAYVILLQQSELDRQLFEVQTKNISKADIPAAIEVDVEYEQGLEKFADALGAYQDRFDQALGERQNTGTMPWLITDQVAMQLDAQADETQAQLSDSEDVATNVSEESETPLSTFRLSTFLELSEKVFMNGTEQKEYEHWSFHAEKGERPGMTSETVKELYELVLNYLRRLIQTTIFLTESRIRSCHTWDHEPAREVRLEDINAMRQILNIDGDLWDYWTTLPRRALFRVVPGDHRRGYRDRSMDIEEVEATLSIRHNERRRRSLSTALNSSQSSLSEPESMQDSDTSSMKLSRENWSEYAEPVPLHISLMPPKNQPADGSGRCREPSFDIEIEDYSDEFDGDGDDNDESGERNYSDEGDTVGDVGAESEHSSASGAEQALPIKMSSRKRRRVEEEGLEIYLQDLDGYDRVQEEQRLTKLLGIGYPSGPAEIYADLGNRPRVRRRLGENVNRWDTEYQAAWEAYDLHRTDQPDAQTEGDGMLHQSVR